MANGGATPAACSSSAANSSSSSVCIPQPVWLISITSVVPSRRWETASERITSSVTVAARVAQHVRVAADADPGHANTSIRASMQVTIANFSRGCGCRRGCGTGFCGELPIVGQQLIDRVHARQPRQTSLLSLRAGARRAKPRTTRAAAAAETRDRRGPGVPAPRRSRAASGPGSRCPVRLGAWLSPARPQRTRGSRRRANCERRRLTSFCSAIGALSGRSRATRQVCGWSITAARNPASASPSSCGRRAPFR